MIEERPAARVSFPSQEDVLRRHMVIMASVLAVSAIAPSQAQAAELCGVAQSMVSAANYWIANDPNHADNNWQNATYHVGNLAVVRTTGVSNHRTLPWADANKYQLPGQDFRPENYTTGEAYLDLYFFHPDPPTLQPLRDRAHQQIAAGKLSEWDTPEAINLAMPAFVRLAEPDITAAANTLFRHAEKLFDERTGLWWHDWRFVGAPVYWSQANGNALAGLMKVLANLPQDDPNRAEYTRVARKMAAKLKELQRPDGSWSADLLHPFLFGPESSGTALITFALGAGVNNGILDASYTSAVTKGWNWLTARALQPTGKLGYVQGPGSAPWDHQPVSADDSAAFAVGDFLIAGQQVAKLTGC
jgi:unsaturated rhamnogalacturonyl hydrolase